MEKVISICRVDNLDREYFFFFFFGHVKRDYKVEE